LGLCGLLTRFRFAEAFRALLFPLQWQCACKPCSFAAAIRNSRVLLVSDIPVLPLFIAGVMDAPVPVCVGILNSIDQRLLGSDTEVCSQSFKLGAFECPTISSPF
jgi:hypothetical protein